MIDVNIDKILDLDIEKDVDCIGLKNKDCCFCKCKLTKENRSIWMPYLINEETEQIYTAYQCVVCAEVSSRMIENSLEENNKFIYNKTEQEVRLDVEKEGLTIAKLKAIEERSEIMDYKLN